MSAIKQYLSAVEEMVRSKFEQRKPHEIRTELNRLRQKYKIGLAHLQEEKRILKLVEKELEDKFIWKFTKEFIDEQYERISDRFEAGVLRSVRRAMSNKNSTEIAIKQVRRLGNVSERYIDTVVRTAKGGLVQAQNISKAIGANIKYFRYMGPKIGARPFCANLVGKIFTIEEIHKMTGQNGLPVIYFCGGYNCRHRWVAVDGRYEDGVFINKSFDALIKNLSKNEVSILKKEMEGAKLLAKFGKVEISDYRKTKNVPDFDIRYEGEFVQLKQPNSSETNVLRYQLEKSKHQNDNLIVIVKSIKKEETSILMAKEWLQLHPNKKLRVLNLETNKFYKVNK